MIRIGLIGAGKRGTKLLSYLLVADGVEIVAVCDVVLSAAENAAEICADSGKKAPAVYGGKKDSVSELLDNENPDAVIITTTWDSHAVIALHAMRKGIYPGIDVPAALTVEDIWQLVETSEETGIPCHDARKLELQEGQSRRSEHDTPGDVRLCCALPLCPFP